MILSPYSTPPAHALLPVSEIHLNSSNVQVVHNAPANTDVLNMSLNVENDGDGLGSCDSEADDLLETGVHVSVSKLSCGAYSLSCQCLFNNATNSLICLPNVLCTTQNGFCGGICPAFDFDAQVSYVEHQIGEQSYGTSFAPNAAGAVASKIVALDTPLFTCGTGASTCRRPGKICPGLPPRRSRSF